MASAQALEWQTFTEKELPRISKHDVHELLSARTGRKIIDSMWVFKVEPDGVFKSRGCLRLSLVAFSNLDSVNKGFSGSRNRL